MRGVAKIRSWMKPWQSRRSVVSRSGFSLLELLSVITILGIIAVVIIPRILYSKVAAQEHACFQNKAEIHNAIERYNLDNGSLPANLAAINNSTWFPNGIPNCPVSNSAYTLNSSKTRVDGHTAGSH